MCLACLYSSYLINNNLFYIITYSTDMKTVLRVKHRTSQTRFYKCFACYFYTKPPKMLAKMYYAKTFAKCFTKLNKQSIFNISTFHAFRVFHGRTASCTENSE